MGINYDEEQNTYKHLQQSTGSVLQKSTLSCHKFCRFVGQARQVAHCGGIRDLKIRDFDTNDILRDLLVPDLEPVSLFLLNRTQNLRSEMGL